MASFMASFPAAGRAIFGGDLNTTTTDLLTMASVARLAPAMLLNPRRFRSPERYEPLFEPGNVVHAVEVLSEWYTMRPPAILADSAITPAGGIVSYSQGALK